MSETSMTKAAKRRHIQSHGCDIYEHGCLYCKQGDDYADSLEFSDFDPVESGDMEQTVTCTKCGRKWIDVFRLVDVREIASGVETMKVSRGWQERRRKQLEREQQRLQHEIDKLEKAEILD